MKKLRLLMIFTILALTTICSITQGQDLLDDLLGSVGKWRLDLGYSPKGYWNRYPFEIPYKLPAFDALLAEPLHVYDYSESMKAAAMQYLDDTTFWDTSNPALYQLTYHLGWERRVGGFRNYSANLTDTLDSPRPMLTALMRIYNSAGASLENRVFGQIDPAIDTSALRQLESQLTPEAQLKIGLLLVDLAEASHYRELAFRNVKGSVITDLYAVTDLDATQGDGLKYYPQFDDCAATIDWQSMVYASYKVAASADKTAKELSKLKIALDKPISFPTPLGQVLFLSSGSDTVQVGDYLLILDPGGNDIYLAGGGSSPTQPVSVLIDLAGDDHYGARNSLRAFGYGNCGVGAVVDVQGNDTYLADRLAQGTGIFGTGLLCDYKGNDNYSLNVSGQGCGYFGLGFLLDREGKDTYYLAGDGQGMGGVGGGIGLLVDYRGDDKYTAEPYASVFDRADYHSKEVINANMAQGCGGGRRGDGSDGHSWAGGLGALIDCYGDDEYYAGNFSQGIGYWFGMGVLYDVNGDDLYKSCYFTQASGAHYCIGALFDESGNDKHQLFETAGAGLSFGWDFTVSMLVDWQGNDSYSGKIISIATAQIRSNSFFFDFGGDDTYQLDEGTDGFGHATFREEYRTPRPTTPFTWYAQSYALLIDVGGQDQFLRRNSKTNTLTPDSVAGSNKRWYQPSRSSDKFGYDNYGMGIDTTTGTVTDFYIFQKKDEDKTKSN